MSSMTMIFPPCFTWEVVFFSMVTSCHFLLTVCCRRSHAPEPSGSVRQSWAPLHWSWKTCAFVPARTMMTMITTKWIPGMAIQLSTSNIVYITTLFGYFQVIGDIKLQCSWHIHRHGPLIAIRSSKHVWVKQNISVLHIHTTCTVYIWIR